MVKVAAMTNEESGAADRAQGPHSYQHMSLTLQNGSVCYEINPAAVYEELLLCEASRMLQLFISLFKSCN